VEHGSHSFVIGYLFDWPDWLWFWHRARRHGRIHKVRRDPILEARDFKLKLSDAGKDVKICHRLALNSLFSLWLSQ
jgi:hypothetical protein